MSAVNLIVHEPCARVPNVAVHLFSDSAAYDKDGLLTATGGKTHLLTSISAAMLMSGRAIASPMVAYLLEHRARSFDDLLENIADWLPEIEDQIEILFGEDDEGFRLLIGGWSEKRKQPVGFAIATISNATHEAFTVIEQGSGQAPSLTQEELIRGFGHMPTIEDTWDIDHLALTMLELQRRHEFTGGGYRVGGHAELVTVTKDRIASKILARWPDEIGKPITPEPMDWAVWRARRRANSSASGSVAPPVAANPNPPSVVAPLMNRAERRRQKALQRAG